jgi:RHS repeat-associated protein
VQLGYDNVGRVNRIDRGWGLYPPEWLTDLSGSATFSSTLSYDADSRLTGASYSNGLPSFTYDYDGYGRVIGSTGPEGSLGYTYDDAGQLIGVSGARTESYSYDATGNRTMDGYVTGTGNRLASDGIYNYTYDDEGNLKLKERIADGQATEYTWDYRNRLTDVTVKDGSGVVVASAHFTYDVEDCRIGALTDADGAGPQAGVQTWTVYDGANPYIDFNAAGQVTARYLHGPGVDEMYARIELKDVYYYGQLNVPTWYVTDRLGSVRALVDYTGAAIDQIVYDSYGNTLSESNPSAGGRLKFTAREWYCEVGLQSNRERWYDPAAGRWISQDPIGFQAGDPDLYRYVGNRPADFADPSGLDWLDDAANVAAGWGDALTGWTPGGGTAALRDKWGINGGIDTSSGWYIGGQVGGSINGILIGGEIAAGGAGLVGATGGMLTTGGGGAAAAGIAVSGGAVAVGGVALVGAGGVVIGEEIIALAEVEGEVRFGKNFDTKCRKHIDQIRNRGPVREDIPSPGRGGRERVQEIIRQRVAQGGGRATTYADEPAIAYEDGGVTYIFRPNGEFWTILRNCP